MKVEAEPCGCLLCVLVCPVPLVGVVSSMQYGDDRGLPAGEADSASQDGGEGESATGGHEPQRSCGTSLSARHCMSHD